MIQNYDETILWPALIIISSLIRVGAKYGFDGQG